MRIRTLILETVTESPTGAVEFGFLPKRRLPYRAGQAGLLVLAGGGAKPFTYASDDRCGRLSIATVLRSGSRFKAALAGLAPGDRARAIGPFGTLPSLDPGEEQVFVAQGIGITPFLSIARSQVSVNAMLLQVGVPHYFGEVAAATAAGAEHYETREELQEAVGQAMAKRRDAHWLLSGRSDFVASLSGQLTTAGVADRRIHKDKFWGMASTSPPTGARTDGSP